MIRPSKTGTPWSDEDLATLRREWPNAKTPGQKRALADRLCRSFKSVETQASIRSLTEKREKRPDAGDHAAPGQPSRLAERLKEAAARADYIPTIGTEMLGEPPPGRSALDGWKQRGREEQEAQPARPRPWDPMRDGKREIVIE